MIGLLMKQEMKGWSSTAIEAADTSRTPSDFSDKPVMEVE